MVLVDRRLPPTCIVPRDICKQCREVVGVITAIRGVRLMVASVYIRPAVSDGDDPAWIIALCRRAQGLPFQLLEILILFIQLGATLRTQEGGLH